MDNATTTGDPLFVLDRTAKLHGGSRMLTPEEALELAATDAAAAVARIREHEARVVLVKRVEWRGFTSGWQWWVEAQRVGCEEHGDVVVRPRRAFTKRGGWRKAHRAYVAELIRQKLAGSGSAAYAMDPACQHYVPFARACKPCGRAEA